MNGISRVSDLFSAARDGDKEALGQVLQDNAGLIWSVTRRFFGRGVEPDDLYQLGCVGFIKAVQGFDDSYGTQFSTYAVPKIAGEIRRFLRDDGLVKVSRSIKEKAHAVRRAQEQLCQSLGREPLLSELAEITGLTAEEIASLELAIAPAESLNKESGEEGFTLEGCLGTGGMEEQVTERVALLEVVATLPQRERMVIDLRYFRGLTQDKAAQALGVSQVQVSRLERRAIESLRKKMIT